MFYSTLCWFQSKPRGNPGKERSSSSDGSSSSSEDSEEEEERRRAREIDVTVKSSNTAESEVPKDMGATKVSEHDTAHEQDYQAQFERVQQRIRDEQEQGPSSSGQKVSAFIDGAQLGRRCGWYRKRVPSGKLFCPLRASLAVFEAC